jgi:hypothetical protein
LVLQKLIKHKNYLNEIKIIRMMNFTAAKASIRDVDLLDSIGPEKPLIMANHRTSQQN